MLEWRVLPNGWQMEDYILVDSIGRETGIKIVTKAVTGIPIDYDVYVDDRYVTTYNSLADAKARADFAVSALVDTAV